MDEVCLLKEFYQKTGLTQEVIARWLGVATYTVHRYLYGRSFPKNKRIKDKIHEMCKNNQPEGLYIPVSLLPLENNQKVLCKIDSHLKHRK